MKGKKRGKSKLLAIFGIFAVVLLITGVLTAEAGSTETASQIQANIEEKTGKEVSEQVLPYVENFIEKKGISSEQINSISEVDFNNLPKEVNIENIDDANLAIYQVNYDKSDSKQDNVFVITYSTEKLKSQGDLIISQDKREFLNFGFNGEMEESGFLKSAVGVEGSLEKGYVMMRKGSITGISTNLEASEGNGEIEIVIYKNGKQIQFGNTIAVDSSGVKKDYDVQSKDTISFEQGDVISAYAEFSDRLLVRDINTLLEITTEN